MRETLHEKKWYPYAVAACIAVVVYVALTHLDTVFDVAACLIKSTDLTSHLFRYCQSRSIVACSIDPFTRRELFYVSLDVCI